MELSKDNLFSQISKMMLNSIAWTRQIKPCSPPKNAYKSLSSALGADNKHANRLRSKALTSIPRGGFSFNLTNALQTHQGDESAPSVKNSFMESNASQNTDIKAEISENIQAESENSTKEANLQEIEDNTCAIKTEDDEIPLSMSFNNFYKGMKARKKLEFYQPIQL